MTELKRISGKIVPWLRLYYTLQACAAFFAFISIDKRSARQLDPTWPCWWLRHVPLHLGLNLIIAGTACALLWAVLRPTSRIARWSTTVTVFLLVSALHSFGSYVNSFDTWLLVNLPLALLSLGNSRSDRAGDVRLVWCAQLIGFSPYFLAGLWKLRIGALAIAQGMSPSQLLAGSLPWHLAMNGLQIGAAPNALLPWLVSHPAASGMLWIAGICLEISTILVAWPERFLRPYAFIMAAFHTTICLVMRIDYGHQIALLAALACSPLASGAPLVYKDPGGSLSGATGRKGRHK